MIFVQNNMGGALAIAYGTRGIDRFFSIGPARAFTIADDRVVRVLIEIAHV